jgi:PAS domain S-box-containing protein
VNDAFCRTYGYAEAEVLGQRVAILRSPDLDAGRSGEILTSTLAGGWHGELLNRKRDGTVFPVEVWTSAVRDHAGAIIAAVGVARDITERTAAQEHIRSSLAEKEMLLKEIHHRVKNNMQVVSSLLNMAGEKAGDAKTRALFKESMSRIRSMALVHEKLYRSPSLAGIDFGEYLRAVTPELMRTHHAPGVSYVVDAQPVALGIDTAIPCGLIVSELISNALKHAFPQGREGKIRVLLHTENPSTVQLTVADDGMGFPAELDFRNAGSMGLNLVVSLAGQIRGSVAMERGTGTAFTVTFPV